jgi:hypothetical protein
MRVTVLVVIAVLVLVGFVAIGYVVPGMEGADAKSAAQALLAGSESAKQQVTGAAEKSGNLAGAGKGIRIEGKKDAKLGELRWVVSEDGAIRGWNGENAIEIALTPTLQAGKVAWTCRGYPHGAMPSSCGGVAAN